MKNRQSIYNRKDIVELGKIVSEKLNVPLRVVLMAYMSFYDKIADDISNMNLGSGESQDDIDNLTLSFNIKHVGKLYSTRQIINKINENIDRKKNESIEHKDGDTN